MLGEEHSQEEKPRKPSVEERLQFFQDKLELATAKCRKIDQTLENLMIESSQYGDTVLTRYYQLFPETPQLSFSFTSLNLRPPVEVSST